VHHYLAFKPLGLRFLASEELRTLNETVADVAGGELARLLMERYPLPQEVEAQLTQLRPPPSAVDVPAALRQLRLDVDALLAAGDIEAAEALMEQRRQELAEQGVVYRRINQAFFAFSGVYATGPGGVDPIGANTLRLLEQEGGVGPFLHAASRLTSASDLDRLVSP
jgi:hypothetical protein